ncbi:hypothetical protein [Bacillus sp. 03113]|uniref:hypothetical protein n=1 Tax=Bacillus sp. 03113 TaxID=2578211 RepID=UPI001142195F|nr:hypothetical protein [Bacillus sp. 03113]
MRVAYSVLREIHKKNFIPQGKDYGLKTFEFEGFIRLLEDKGYVERVLRVNYELRLGPARLTEKGKKLLETYKHYEEDYPDKRHLKDWVKIEKEQYSNGAEEEDY